MEALWSLSLRGQRDPAEDHAGSGHSRNVASIRTRKPAIRTSNAGITRRARYPARIIWSSEVSAA
jgi:hypothetical protein